MAETREAWRPRFIKIGVNNGPLDELDRKLVRAAAITARETGLTIASHAGDGAAVLEQLEIVAAEGTSLWKFVWVHAQNEHDHALHEVLTAHAAEQFTNLSRYCRPSLLRRTFPRSKTFGMPYDARQ
jgi:phosphotriesterase-related protein